MRVTTHNGRATKGKAYSAKHNDRNFGQPDEHIDPALTQYNTDWHYYQDDPATPTFDDAERRFYEETFGDALNAKNERYRKNGHKSRMQTVDQYRKNARTCPEETIWQIGKHDETIDPALLGDIFDQFMAWRQDAFPQVVVLDASLHVDETQCAPHIHERHTWVCHDKDGLAKVGQGQALEEMGIERPDPSAPQGRYNNAKQTYTRMCRDKFIEIAREHGLELELTPQEPSKSGLTLTEYKTRQEQEKAAQAVLARDKAIVERNQAFGERTQALLEKVLAQEQADLAQVNYDKLNQYFEELGAEVDTVKQWIADNLEPGKLGFVMDYIKQFNVDDIPMDEVVEQAWEDWKSNFDASDNNENYDPADDD